MIRPTTILISIMHANNEIGTIQPIKEVSEIAKFYKILFHSDAAQSIGKIPFLIPDLGVDFLSIAGHKMYAPKGIGALYIKKGLSLKKWMHGANQERGLRAGTENVIEVVGLGKSAETLFGTVKTEKNRLNNLRNKFVGMIQQSIPEVKINGGLENCLPNTANLSFPTIPAHKLLESLPMIAASAGAACHSGSTSISHVLKSIQLDDSLAKSAIRFSFGKKSTETEITQAAHLIMQAINKLKNKEKDQLL